MNPAMISSHYLIGPKKIDKKEVGYKKKCSAECVDEDIRPTALTCRRTGLF